METQTTQTPTTNKGFIKDAYGNKLLPITRAELVLDQDGNIALNSGHFLAGGRNQNGGTNPIGLITAEERAMLTGDSSTGVGGITDINTKLGYINEGLIVDGTTISFYDTNGATPINLVGTDNQIAISVDENNTLGISLDPLYSTEEGNLAPSVEDSILKGITVDNFGRVTGVTGGIVTSTDIDVELKNKTLTNCVCTVDSTAADNNIVNKWYVDQKIEAITGVATGALRFGGSITSDDLKAENGGDKTTEFLKNINHYYKATESFQIDGAYNYENTDINVKVGDTLIINENQQFVHVPSGDDITSITVSGKDASGDDINAINKQVGQVDLKFDEIFTLSQETNTDGDVIDNKAVIGLKQVSIESSGYLSSGDYIEFKKLKKVSYEQINEVNSYEIGTLTIGDDSKTIYGKDTTYSIGLIKSKDNESNDQEIDPILQFTDSNNTSTDITYKGVNGINVSYGEQGKQIIFSPNFTIADDSTDYLSFNNGTFTVNVGQTITNPDTNEVVVHNGITPYNEFRAVRYAVIYRTETISNSLVTPENWKDDKLTYHYGSEALKKAINVTI